MKQLIRLTALFCSCAALAVTVVAGPEPISSGKEMKQVAPAPVIECNWTGFYIGVNVGGNWGHAEDLDIDGYQAPAPHEWGYDTSGVIAGGTIGYNYQWNWLVLGIEADLGYMNIEGDGVSDFDRNFFASDTRGQIDSDFYTTIRGRLGLAFGHWMFYVTGGGIGVNVNTRVVDNCDTSPCGDDLIDAGTTDFVWGWTAGGGVEYMFGCHWTIKGEYLRYRLDDTDFSGTAINSGFDFRFRGIHPEGNIVRAGLNYKF